jgi:nitrate reductase NapAB chaperone NapD
MIFPATSFQNLETELNGLRSTVYNLNSILVELNNVCDDSIIYELEKDIQELNERYGSIGQKIKKHKAQNEEMISAFEAFNKDCTEMLAWLQCQCDVLDRENEEAEPPLLASELAQLKQCEVSSKDRKPKFVLANKSRLNEDHKINASREKHTNVIIIVIIALVFLLKELQREVDRQHEFLAAVRSHGQELKSRIKQGSLFVSPKLEKLEQRFNDFSSALNEKQER